MNSLDYVCNWRGSIDSVAQAEARAELAQLRAQAAQAEALEQAVNEAQEVMNGVVGFFAYGPARRWLAAHAAERRMR